MLSEMAMMRINEHWAVAALEAGTRERAFQLAAHRVATKPPNRATWVDVVGCREDDALLEHVSLAYEVAAIEGMESILKPTHENFALREQCMVAASRAFDLRRAMNIPGEWESKIFQVLLLGALAYCGERWVDLRSWLKAHPEVYSMPYYLLQEVKVASGEGRHHAADGNPGDDVPWRQRIIERLYQCWVTLFLNQDKESLLNVVKIIEKLQVEQATFETRALSIFPAERRNSALILGGLYHFAKATELLSSSILNPESENTIALLDRHFEAAGQSAMTAGEAQLTVLLRWLQVASRQMISESEWNNGSRESQKNISGHKSVRLLIVVSRPIDQSELMKEWEIEAIKKAIARNMHRSLDVKVVSGSVQDLLREMVSFKPDFIHFSGHHDEGGVYLLNELGLRGLVPSQILGRVFQLFRDTVTCVFLSACYSEAQANAIKQYVSHVIGTSASISDDVASRFSAKFYEAIADGNDITVAFRFAKASASLNSNEEDAFVMKSTSV